MSGENDLMEHGALQPSSQHPKKSNERDRDSEGNLAEANEL